MQSNGAERDRNSDNALPLGGSGFRIHLAKHRSYWKLETRWALILIVILSFATIAAATSLKTDLVSVPSAKSLR